MYLHIYTHIGCTQAPQFNSVWTCVFIAETPCEGETGQLNERLEYFWGEQWEQNYCRYRRGKKNETRVTASSRCSKARPLEAHWLCRHTKAWIRAVGGGSECGWRKRGRGEMMNNSWRDVDGHSDTQGPSGGKKKKRESRFTVGFVPLLSPPLFLRVQ